MKWSSTRTFLALTAAGCLGFMGCSSGSDGPQTGELSLGLTDGPVEDAEHVWIQFTGLELKLAGDPPEGYPFDPDSCDVHDAFNETCRIDLLALAGTEQRTIFVEDLPVGDVEWVRLMVDAELNTMDSYIELYDEAENLLMCSLWIPSGSETGLKLVGGLTVVSNGSRYMLDFDVARSIVQPPGLAAAAEEPTVAEMCVENYVMKPTIRIIDETEAGSITGIVDRGVLYELNEQSEEVLVESCRDENLDGVVDYLSVYAFEDFADQPDPAVLDDYDREQDPVASAIVEHDVGSQEYSYEMGYLLTGHYRLGLTCTPDVDAKETDNFGCDFQDAACEETSPPFGFIAERELDVLVDPMNNGDFFSETL
jgi:hypothetical protein